MKPFTLVGVDGNAFCVMGYVQAAMRRNGFSKTEIDEYQKQATSSDYNNLLCVSMDYIEKVNNKLRCEGLLDEDDCEEDW